MRPGLESFDIECHVGETEIVSTVSSSQYITTVEVTMPYGTDVSNLVPTFEVGEDIENVTDMKRYDFANGVDALTIDSDDNALVLWKGDVLASGGASGTDYYIVKVDVTIAPNTASALESIQVVDGNDKSNVINVTAPGTVNVEMPKGYDFSNGTSVTLKLKGSDNAKVEVLGQTGKEDTFDGDGEATINGVNITSKSFKLRVTSEEEGATANEYTINLSAATVADPKLYVPATKANSDTCLLYTSRCV